MEGAAWRIEKSTSTGCLSSSLGCPFQPNGEVQHITRFNISISYLIKATHGIYESRRVLAGTPTRPAKTALQRLSLSSGAEAAIHGRPRSGLIKVFMRALLGDGVQYLINPALYFTFDIRFSFYLRNVVEEPPFF